MLLFKYLITYKKQQIIKLNFINIIIFYFININIIFFYNI